MKKIQMLLMIVCSGLLVNAQNEAYRGGASDGHSRTEQVTAFPFPTSFQPYLGGSGDGYAIVEMVTPLGFANNFAPFLGGSGDGYTSLDLTNQVFAFPPQFYAYLGGANDGWTGYLVPNALILPLTLFQFSGEEQDGKHWLYWTTENEVNTSHFAIERSNNGQTFLPLAQVAAKGNFSGRTDYHVVDSLPLKGTNYYRIKMWDKDGKFKYSPIILLEKQSLVNALIVFPNPVSQSLRIKLAEPVSQAIQWTVHDLTGRRVVSQQTSGGSQLYQINVAHLPAGNYILEVEFDKRKERIQFTKQ